MNRANKNQIDQTSSNTIIKMAKTALVLNYYLQGSVRANAQLPQQSPSLGKDGFLSMEKRP